MEAVLGTRVLCGSSLSQQVSDVLPYNLRRYLMGVASLGGLSPAGSCGSEDAPPTDAAAAAGSVDFAGALYHFGHAQQMLDRLREEAAEQGEPNAQVSTFALRLFTSACGVFNLAEDISLCQ